LAKRCAFKLRGPCSSNAVNPIQIANNPVVWNKIDGSWQDIEGGEHRVDALAAVPRKKQKDALDIFVSRRSNRNTECILDDLQIGICCVVRIDLQSGDGSVSIAS